MKKILMFIGAIAIVSASCTRLEEEPVGKLLVDGFFKSSNELNMAVNAMYNRVNNIGHSEHEWFVPLMGGDDMTSNPSQPEMNGDIFNLTDASGDVKPNWQNIYGMVSAANFIINGREEATKAIQLERDQAAGQAYFVRAFAYFNGTRFFGSIPLVTSNDADLTLKKSTPAEVYALVVDDLLKAEEMLPDRWPAGIESLQKPTSGTAKGLLASVYLNRAGWPVNGGAADYRLAADKAKEVIDNSSDMGGSGKYTYKLLDNFADLWVDKQTNDELMFGTFYNNTVPNATFRAPFFGAPGEESGWDVYFAEINFFNNFPEGPRKDATFQTVARKSNDGGKTVELIPWQNFATKHPYFRKMRASNGKGDGSPTPTELTPWDVQYYHSSRTSQVMRYAEIKLIYAEAQAMAEGPNGFAYQQINDIRHRAGLAPLTPGLGQTAFRDAVVEERAWEFAGPEFASRWFDLVRLERVESANSNRHPLEVPLVRAPSKAVYFAPIPSTEVSLNPNLAPNVAPLNPM